MPSHIKERSKYKVKYFVIVTACLISLTFVMSESNAFDNEINKLQKCTDDNGYYDEVKSAIQTPIADKIIVSYTAFPSFEAESGILVFKSKNAYLLRVVTFKTSVWHGAFREYKPGHWRREPTKANYEHEVKEVSISSELAKLLQETVAKEINSKSDEGSFGFDGEAYQFSTGDNTCGETWSPNEGSQPAKLLEIFDSLRTLSSIPTDFLRQYWEYFPLMKLKAFPIRNSSKS